MKVFPVYMNSLMKTAPLVGSTELSTDGRAHQRLVVMAMGVEDTQLLLYPRLIPLHNMELEGEAVPSPLRCSEDRLADGGERPRPLPVAGPGLPPPSSSRGSSTCPRSLTCSPTRLQNMCNSAPWGHTFRWDPGAPGHGAVRLRWLWTCGRAILA
ncbi:protein transport protein Sec24D isoform X1 [Gadus morhua]|uniref:protein transport protein Sec24D isoform X1 n=1 Tax=Gadus morhua TaxID=8049 RepID=UPI0011B41FB7|nr:protein transport protein Sec24D-like isoform X1 [Gadus morhua]XP_030193437.1 protein transport protein Sec24D-like isoform X1 [Gadus morhua]XP_030193438.1 protein transport protein Sec24D-like isoform X1 [Gadus morhua]XP_030193439.1 protein transport protein Sec24D-like isoform X1 [Gadus morhua]